MEWNRLMRKIQREKLIGKFICFFLGHNYSDNFNGKGFASLDGWYIKAQCARCGHSIHGRY